jgi:SAM-dependent methyltransferase
MSKHDIFDRHLDDYENWFIEHALAYASELRAIRKLIPPAGAVLEVGVGSGRFAAPLQIPFGVDPSLAMLRLARKRGTRVVSGTGEHLPSKTGALDAVLMVVTLCFLDEPERALAQIHRALKPGGALVCGFVDAQSALGKTYAAQRDRNPFYGEARFFTAAEVRDLMEKAGFTVRDVMQTLSGPLETMEEPEDPRPGTGKGSFVVLRGVKAVQN